MTNKNFSFENCLRVKIFKVDIACKQIIRIGHKKYNCTDKKTFLNSDYKMKSIAPLRM